MIKDLFKYVFASVILATSFSACEKVVDIDLKDLEPRLVLNGFLGADSIPTIQLSRSLPATESDDKFPAVTNAGVVLKLANGDEVPLVHSEGGLYKPENAFSLKQGQKVSVEVNHDDYSQISAQQTIPNAIPIESIRKEELDNGEVRLHIKFTDPEAVKNYYRIVLVKKETYSLWSWNEDGVVQEEILQHHNSILDFKSKDPVFEKREDEMSSYENPSNSFSDALFNGSSYEITLETEYLSMNNIYGTLELVVELHSITRDYFLFTRSLPMHEDTKDSPFTEPVIVHNNIKNGFGILGGYSVSTHSFIWEESDETTNFK